MGAEGSIAEKCPAHAAASEDIADLAQYNIDKVLEIADKITGICREPLCFEVILTGLGEQELAGTKDGAGDANIGDVPISSGGAFVLEPGKGSTNENGQFVIRPDEWQYVPSDGTPSESSTAVRRMPLCFSRLAEWPMKIIS